METTTHGVLAVVAPGTFVLDVPTTDPGVLAQVLQAMAPHLGPAMVTTAPSSGSLAATSTAITVALSGQGWLDGVAVVAAAVASDYVPQTSVAWAGSDAVV